MRLSFHAWLLFNTHFRLKKIKVWVNRMNYFKMLMVNFMFKKWSCPNTHTYISSIQNSLFMVNFDINFLGFIFELINIILKILLLFDQRLQLFKSNSIMHFLTSIIHNSSFIFPSFNLFLIRF